MKEELLKIIDSVNTDMEKMKKINWEEKMANIEFPELQGSEKQISWANDIKKSNVTSMILSSIDNYNWFLDAQERFKDSRRYETFKERLENQIEEIEKYINETSAKVIIETR